MNNQIQLYNKQSHLYLFCITGLVFVMALLISVHFATPLDGISVNSIKQLNSGWMIEHNEGEFIPIGNLPQQLNTEKQKLLMKHELKDISVNHEKTLTIRTRYNSIRVWADEKLIYEAARGKEHALSSMWHFISAENFLDSSALYVELEKYDSGDTWELSEILFDYSGIIRGYLLYNAIHAIIFWIVFILFTVILLFIAVLMAFYKVPAVSSILALALFTFFSGQWILLDTKITTIFGGNYALSYFFSYAFFYLLLVPYLMHIQLMVDKRNRILYYLTWFVVGNAALCMLLHAFGIVSIQDTAFTVHILIFLSLCFTLKAFWKAAIKYRKKNLVFTFWGTVLILITSLISVILYYAGKLPPTNYTFLYSWGLLVMLFCMIIDTIGYIGRILNEQKHVEHYKKLAVQDSMTMLGNRNAYEMFLYDLSQKPLKSLTFIIFDIDDMKYLNDTFGHHIGDRVIYITAQCIRETFDMFGNCYRIGGDEFCVIVSDSLDVELLLQKFDLCISAKKENNAVSFTVSYGWETKQFKEKNKISHEEITAMQIMADKKLYHHKKAKPAKE